MRTISWMFVVCTLLLFSSLFSMQESRSPTPLKARPPSTLTLEENLGLHIRFSDIETRLTIVEEAIRHYSPVIEQLHTDLENANRIIVSNNEVIDALHQYQVSVNEIIPFLQKVIVSKSKVFNEIEMSRFAQVMETVIAAEADCKKKTYGE